MRQESRPRFSFASLSHPFIVAGLLALCIVGWILAPVGAATAMAARLPANASCAQLAHADPTATNGPSWGETLMPGFGAVGGWFGVPICANSVNRVAPGGANVSCDRVPTNFAASGCAPGGVTEDGYGWSFQCVELVIRFTAWAFGAPTGDWHGDAQYLWLSGDHPASFTPSVNGGTTPPVPGDILVWGSLDSQGRIWPAGPSGGHVAVVAATSASSISFVEENMLTRAGNIPEETTSLNKNGVHWTIGHTYATSGGRALYGWLHESGNDGRFTGGGTQQSTSASAAPGATLPSLAQAVTITSGGALAQLVWSDTRTANRPSGAIFGTPSAVAESLGAPPGVALAPDQRPAVVSLPDGARYVYARGQDGHLYAAYTPGLKVNKAFAASVLWQDLGAPPGLSLASGASAIWDGRDITVVALASDGAVWTRSGPPGLPGLWTSLGLAPSGAFVGAPALVREAASATSANPKASWWVALAVGRDGALYETDRSSASSSTNLPVSTVTTTTSQQPGVWTPWKAVMSPGLSTTLVGAVFMFSETTETPAHSASAAAIDALVADSTGELWALHRGAPDQAWQTRSYPAPASGASLLSASGDFDAEGSPALTAYVSDSTGGEAPAAARAAEPTILTSVLPVEGTSATQPPSWSLVGRLPVTSAASVGVSALTFGPNQRALLLTQGATVGLIGDAATLDTLAPGATVIQLNASDVSADFPALAGAGAVALGTVAPAANYSDNFDGAALDPRWAVSAGAASNVSLAAGSVTLNAENAASAVSLSQGTIPDAGSVTAQVTPGESWRAGGSAQAGIALSLDTWNDVSLSVRADGTVALCPVVAGAVQTCATTPVPAALDGAHTIFLRISRADSSVRASVSADGVSWTPAGSWSVPWAPSAGTPLGAYAPLVAPAGSANPGGLGAVPLAFTSLSLYVSGQVTPAAGGQAPAAATGATARFAGLAVSSDL